MQPSDEEDVCESTFQVVAINSLTWLITESRRLSAEGYLLLISRDVAVVIQGHND